MHNKSCVLSARHRYTTTYSRVLNLLVLSVANRDVSMTINLHALGALYTCSCGTDNRLFGKKRYSCKVYHPIIDMSYTHGYKLVTLHPDNVPNHDILPFLLYNVTKPQHSR